MPVYYSVAKFGKAFEAKLDKIKLEPLAVHKLVVREAIKDHSEYTNGRISTRELRSMGHPFGRNFAGRTAVGRGANRGRRRVKTLPINRQTGDLRRSFFKREVGSAVSPITQMGFGVGYAKYVLSPTGTKKMVARGFYSVAGSPGIIRRRHMDRMQIIKHRHRQNLKTI